jgi:uncharacterized protein (TIGR03083 family)
VSDPTAAPAAHPAPLDHLAALERAQAEFAAVLASADPEAPVAACAPWHVADLALHLGGVHWWASAMALGVDLDPHEPPGPRDSDSLVTFYSWSAAHLRATLAERDPQAPALTLLGPGVAGFWHRRQLHETLVHLWDLAAATGARTWLDAEPAADADLAWADAVAEVVDTMAPRQVRLGRIGPLADAVELVAAGRPRAADARTWRLGDGEPAARVHGTPRDLALLLWHRVAPGERSLRVEGDAAVLDRLLALRLTP